MPGKEEGVEEEEEEEEETISSIVGGPITGSSGSEDDYFYSDEEAIEADNEGDAEPCDEENEDDTESNIGTNTGWADAMAKVGKKTPEKIFEDVTTQGLVAVLKTNYFNVRYKSVHETCKDFISVLRRMDESTNETTSSKKKPKAKQSIDDYIYKIAWPEMRRQPEKQSKMRPLGAGADKSYELEKLGLANAPQYQQDWEENGEGSSLQSAFS
ncbi:hypothetical protein P7K49_036114 [Saguinus oedipus]|uniref:Uncharacterized protein n=1 Tax=Saguinus oedipus TaxID=9490 RepID=A0ABQ9TPI0_SAGOE|nr:hypothetical protein P7K49_036114 [Saguinus oedipus]